MTATHSWRLGALACGTAIALGCAACSGSTADAPVTSAVGTTASASVIEPSGEPSSITVSSSTAPPTPSVIDVPTPIPSASTQLDPEAREMADRAAIEAQWNRFWDAVLNIVKTPESERQQMMAAVSVDPVLSEILAEASDSDSKSLDRWGVMVAHPYWEQSISGQGSAVMGDCQDASGSGVIDTVTGKKTTVGVSNNNIRAVFVLGADNVWRVQNIYYLVDVEC